MVNQYPHTGTLKWKTEPIQDVDLKWTEGQDVSEPIKCRIEPGAGRYTGTDGNVKLFRGYKVFAPKLTFTIPDGAHFAFNGKSLPVIHSLQSQLHTVIWL